MAKYAARPEKPIPPGIAQRNWGAERISDVDTSYVVPLTELPDLPSGLTSQQTGEHADYRVNPVTEVTDLRAVREARDVVFQPVREVCDNEPDLSDMSDDELLEIIRTITPQFPGHLTIPEVYHHIARFPLTAMGGGKILSNGSFEFTLRVDAADIERVLPLYRKRQDGLLFYTDFYALPIAEIPEGFTLR